MDRAISSCGAGIVVIAARESIDLQIDEGRRDETIEVCLFDQRIDGLDDLIADNFDGCAAGNFATGTLKGGHGLCTTLPQDTTAKLLKRGAHISVEKALACAFFTSQLRCRLVQLTPDPRTARSERVISGEVTGSFALFWIHSTP